MLPEKHCSLKNSSKFTQMEFMEFWMVMVDVWMSSYFIGLWNIPKMKSKILASNFNQYFYLNYCSSEENQLYDIMYDHFPNQFPKNEIKDKIKYLESRFDPRLVPEDNKDDESEFFNTYANSERLLQCFQSVQCRKCTLFFCIHHDCK